jgi:hypothetical protein
MTFRIGFVNQINSNMANKQIVLFAIYRYLLGIAYKAFPDLLIRNTREFAPSLPIWQETVSMFRCQRTLNEFVKHLVRH